MLQICNKPKYRELTLFSGLIELHVALNRFEKNAFIFIVEGICHAVSGINVCKDGQLWV